MKQLLVLFAIVIVQLNTYAQSTYGVNGTVKNAKGEKIQAATVFMAGSEKITSTDKDGNFRFTTVSPGTYQVVVNILGYASSKQNVIVKDRDETVELTLSEKQIMLDEVLVGDKKGQAKHLKTFIKYFIGDNENGRACKILNPQVLEFSTIKNTLKATTADFLIIDNNNLGYRIKYLLKSFTYDSSKEVTLYEGDCLFEPLTGTPEQQVIWDKNRQNAYEGSLMHYLRSLYANTARTEGFLIYKIVSPFFPLVYESLPIPSEQLIKRPDSNFMVFRTNTRFYILYDKKKANKVDKPEMVRDVTLDDLSGTTGSIFMVDSPIDRRGSYADYKKILIQGFWGRKRIGDQLPLEYVSK
jgi:hypothetical protein